MSARHNGSQAVCHVCKRGFDRSALRSFSTVRPGISALIEAEASGWREGCYICEADSARFRRYYVEKMLEAERGELSAIDRSVLDSMDSGTPLSRNPDVSLGDDLTFGEAMADRVARFGGSWPFILIFLVVLIGWVMVNISGAIGGTFDPYPFILLNLILSCVAALQAPIIMMSQRRQETKDRLRSENDYRVNLKAELEIRQLHEKIDHQLARQWERLVEMQQIQIELLEERSKR